MELFKYGFLLLVWLLASSGGSVFAEDRSFYSPVIYIDTEQNQILISTSGNRFCHGHA